ncbi:MAG: SusD/RagB family nutrient-binding outer membrane lipoprotein [Nostocales cyanobacterium 94392]|nr:SusD/RagB family nutrient-binding outer membrane lipoprotein [Nostocales cyanobacterium 94392]
MKTKHKLLITFLMLVAIGGNSCKKYLDINTNPLTATTVEPKLLFGYAITAWDANKNSGDSWIPIGLMVQNMASGGNFGWGAGDVYDMSPFSLNNTWNMYYNSGGNNLKLAIKAAEEADPKNNNTAAQCKIILAQMMYEATTLFGDIPYSEAFQAEKFPEPHFDPQKQVLENIIVLLDEAIAQIDPASPLKITDYDVFYGGDLTKWIKLANSLKFKVLMVMVDKDPSKAAQIGALLADPNNMISSPSDNQVFKHYTTTNQENPKYRLFKKYTNGVNQWFFANKNVFDYMAPLNDPRIPRYFDKGPNANDYIAVNTEQEADETTALISAYLYRKDAPSVFLSYQEILLLQAEAYARGLGVNIDLAKSQQLFHDGVQAAMNFYEADPTEINTYLTTQLPDLTSVADPVKEIHIQQWIDLMDRPLDAFVQWRRSGTDGNEVPALTLPAGAPAGPLIRRYTLAPVEKTSNSNIPTPLPLYYDKMWFDL